MTHQNDSIPERFCQCGCGGKPSGPRSRFLRGHNEKVGKTICWVEEDRGYETLCWIWKGGLSPSGYALVFDRSIGNGVRVHRLEYERKYGPIPNGMIPDHLCRQRDCVNPDHIEIVEPAVNVQRGNLAKLNPDLVREIRSRYPGTSMRAIARDLGVADSCIRKVIHRRSWKNVA